MERAGFWKEIITKIKKGGGCGASLSAKQGGLFFMFFAIPLVFAIFLSLSVNALIPSLKTGMEALLFSEEKVS